MTPLWYGGAYSGGAASGAVDWDTYENGIFFVNTFTDRDNAVSTPLQKKWQGIRWDGPLKEPAGVTHTYYNLSQSIYRQGPRTLNTGVDGRLTNWGDDSGRPVVSSQGSGTSNPTDSPPYIAVYDVTRGEWQGVASGGNAGSNRLFYTTPVMFDPSASYANTHESVNNRVIIVSYEQDPGDISGWRDYDGPDDWDTWEDGIYSNPSNGSSPNANGAIVKQSTSFVSTSGVGFAGFYQFAYPVSRYWNTAGGDTVPTAVAVWNQTDSQWLGWSKPTATSSGNATVTWNVAGSSSSYMTGAHVGKHIIYVYLTREPTNFANWRDYDGPLYSGWDDPNFPYNGHAASSGKAYANTASIAWDWTSGTLVGSTHIGRANTYGLRVYGSHSNSHSVGATYRVYWDSYHGWMFNGPSTATHSIPDIDTFPFSLSYGSHYTNAPGTLFHVTSNPGDISNWAAYDGPVANWDTYANGVFVVNELSQGPPTLTPVPAYAATTYSSYMDDSLAVSTNVGIQTPYNTPEQNADSPPYIAVYIHEYHDNQGGYAHNAKGWYVFERPAIPASNGPMMYTPYAWPGDVSTGDTVNVNNDEGYLGSGGNDNFGYIVVFLDEYNDPVGAGGTDHWKKPPMVHIGSVSALDTASNSITVNWGTYLNIGSGGYDGVYNGFDTGGYPYNPIRGTAYAATTGKMYIGANVDIGSCDVEVYTNSVLTHTGILNTSGVSSWSVKNFAITEQYYSDFDVYVNALTVGDEIVSVIYYND